MTEFYPSVMAETMIARLTAEVARWRRHGVLITVDCPINGAGCEEMHEATLDTGPCPCGGGVGLHRCKACDGTGKVLKDGADLMVGEPRRTLGYAVVPLSQYPLDERWYLFPASWLEGPTR